MLPGLDGIPAAAVLDRLSLLKYRNARGSRIYVRPSGEHRFTVLDDLKEATLARVILFMETADSAPLGASEASIMKAKGASRYRKPLIRRQSS
jgi:hypothetical protein